MFIATIWTHWKDYEHKRKQPNRQGKKTKVLHPVSTGATQAENVELLQDFKR